LSAADIKAAYHRALLKHHPDKSNSHSNLIHHHQTDQEEQDKPPTIDVDQLKEAYITLSSPRLRAEYDLEAATSSERPNDGSGGRGPRPAQIISLGEFAERSEGLWYHACRCGGEYVISEQDMEKECHLVGCNSCSEVIWVGYEVADEDLIYEADQDKK